MPLINTFVYEACFDHQVATPDIPVYACRSFGQCGEDIIVAALLSAVASRSKLDLSQMRYLEIGANHPIATSASLLLQERFGMSGVLVEANADLLPALEKVRPNDTIVHAAITTSDDTFVEFHVSRQNELSSLSRRFVEEWRDGAIGVARTDTVPALRVGALLAKHFPDRAPDYLSIDIEGMDLEILRDWDWSRWRPMFVQVEPSDHFIVANSEAIIGFLAEQGYVLVAKTDVNLILIDSYLLEHDDMADAMKRIVVANHEIAELQSLVSQVREEMSALGGVVTDREHALRDVQAASELQARGLSDALEALRWEKAERDALQARHEAILHVYTALPLAIRELENHYKNDGEWNWLGMALRRPWEVTAWQTARRLRRRAIIGRAVE